MFLNSVNIQSNIFMITLIFIVIINVIFDVYLFDDMQNVIINNGKLIYS